MIKLPSLTNSNEPAKIPALPVRLEFFSDLGKFSNNGKAVFKNGKAEIQFFPGTKAGQAQISIAHPKMATDFLLILLNV